MKIKNKFRIESMLTPFQSIEWNETKPVKIGRSGSKTIYLVGKINDRNNPDQSLSIVINGENNTLPDTPLAFILESMLAFNPHVVLN